MTNLYQPQSDRIDRALLYAGFVVTGIITTLLAPMLPVFAARWSLSDAMVGCFFPAQFIGSKLGNIILSAGLIQRASFRSIFVLGYAAMCAGVGALGVGLGWPLSLIAVFCYGIGIGITIPATNLWISKANPAHRSAELNLLNLAWSVGALLGPAALAACNRLWNFATFLFAVAALAAAVSACLLCTNRPRLISESVEAAEIERQRVPVPAVVCMALLFFLYVGVENSVSGWISSIARGASSTNSHWMLAPSFFWGMLLAGRATAACVVRRVQELRLAIAGLVLQFLNTCRSC